MTIRTLAFVLSALPLCAAGGDADWAMNATVIEACSCPMFCQCYFNAEPAAHHDHGGGAKHFCKANNAYKVNTGHYGATSLDGVKFWLAGDLGGDFSKGNVDWGVVYIDKSASQEQVDGLKAILPHVFPVHWASLKFERASIDTWEYDKTHAVATLDGGKMGEVRLRANPGTNDPGQPTVIQNLRYWGAPRNTGFVLMPNEVEAYRVGPKAFEFKGSNGFMLTLDISSRDMGSQASM